MAASAGPPPLPDGGPAGGTGRLAAAVIVAWLAVHIVVPALGLFGPQPAPFVWHMYSAKPKLPEAWIEEGSGEVRPVDLRSLFVAMRGEIDYSAALRSGLCEATGAAAIRILPPGAHEPERIACR